MKLTIQRASNKPLNIKGYKYKDLPSESWWPEGEVTITRLTELLKFIKEYGSIVIGVDKHTGQYDITIYDDYME